MFIDKWMKMSRLPFITFLKNNIKYRYLLHCICDLAPYEFENNPRNQAPNREYCKTCYVDPIEKIGIRQRKYPNTVKFFLYVLRLVRIKNTGPLRFKLTRFHCILILTHRR